MRDIVPAQVVSGRVDQLGSLTMAAGWASHVGYQKLLTSRFIW
jgi:hypothetical protein